MHQLPRWYKQLVVPYKYVQDLLQAGSVPWISLVVQIQGCVLEHQVTKQAIIIHALPTLSKDDFYIHLHGLVALKKKCKG